MRNAALVLGIIAGLVGMVVGFFSYGYTAFIDHFGEIDGMAEQVANVEMIRVASILSPLLALARGCNGAGAGALGRRAAVVVLRGYVLRLWVQRLYDVPDCVCRGCGCSGPCRRQAGRSQSAFLIYRGAGPNRTRSRDSGPAPLKIGTASITSHSAR